MSAFVDANVFIYAFLRPTRKLQPHELSIKDAAKKIVTRINDVEKVETSVVHFSEICNVLEDHLQIGETLNIEKSLLFQENVLIREVCEEHYLKAISIAQDLEVGVNDALAYVLMKEQGLQKVYSFDKDFDKFQDIQRITE
jgi:predicted nucleic acid-binding protein